MDDYATVKFHVDGAGTLDRNKLEIIRSRASQYLGVPDHSVVVAGITVTNSYLVTFFYSCGI